MQYSEMTGLRKINFKSPIYEIDKWNNNTIYMMRDDLIPFSFGGNKARKAYYFFDKILKENYNYVITYGSASSNHCRVIANLAKKYEIPCTIISTEQEELTNNKIMCELFGVEFVYCQINEVKDTISQQIKLKEKMGFKPYFIQGGGHGNLGTQAYIDAYQEMIDFENENDIKFDYIFHASGTGTTQAGLVLGKMLHASKAKVIGISIARRLPKGRDIVIESIEDYINEFNIKKEFDKKDVIFIEDYILEGYGKHNEEILEVIKETLLKTGIALDSTYTGKAFWGMKKYINRNKIQNKKILFIHTGGTPLFFDDLKELKG